MVRVALRADASAEIGSGHVMRCLTLADALRARGADTVLLSRGLPESLRARAERGGHRVFDLPSGPEDAGEGGPRRLDEEADASACLKVLAVAGAADRLVVDHYGLGAAFERAMQPAAGWIAVIDDLADRAHACDVLLDQNLFADAGPRYAGLVPDGCRALLGPRFALLREEFACADLRTRARDGAVHELLVFTGWADHAGMTLRALEAVGSLGRDDLRVTCVIGGTGPHVEAVARACAGLPHADLVVDAPDMAAHMARADLAIGAAGTATWERCFLGLPVVLASFADNQVPVAAGIAAAGAGVDLGLLPTAEAIAGSVRALLDDPDRVRAMSAAGRRLTRGARPGRRGELAARVIAGPSACVLRPIAPKDEALVLGWRNSARIRERSISDRPITSEEHHDWFVRALDDLGSLHWIFEHGGRPVGVVQLAAAGEGGSARIWGFYLGEESAVPGLGTAMCGLALREAFEVEGAESVAAEVLGENEPSLRLHERLGFRRTGTRTRVRSQGPAPTVLFEVDSAAWRRIEDTWNGDDPCGVAVTGR